MDIMLGSRPRRRTRATVCRAVAQYTERWGWPVVPGAHLVRGDRCSCGLPHCAAPGRHPEGPPAARLPGGTRAADVEQLWPAEAETTVLLPLGDRFDALDVPEAAGCRAMVRLERMGSRLGPVLALPDGRADGREGRRTLFFVAPGAAAELPDLLYKMGWDDAGLDVVCHGRGEYLPAPPSVLARWLRPPSAPTAARPPEARLLLGTLAYACHRTREPAPAP
ncbi:hypothetical protein BIV57_14775 [Mangrovactinospora gilvigrisea]|uniref:DNA primase/polymerase bifunctional N-terminal domain-containing protein n=1 Tax=Mangrovactinospora gilvigrisea TaxID=1428644 RepID=A0A1J7BDQ7_9ACTN|nr:bifunctional DNA primase/polymerase [Mangrovactinospora gilvigrisea]OIV36717.1 hypothetical protein BIV57_14775 [Mangrovactinospora gilvigrisea]